eukprot:NODE_122_length_18870_cov_0.236908.p10 type:complete len:194 gc:universal NODE_122_length_18870_cov_0.236908:17391-17972(+)
MRQEVIQQAVDFLSVKGNLRDQIKFLEDKGLSPKEIYYAMSKSNIYIPLKHNYFTSLLLGGGLIFAASKLIEYALETLIKPIQVSIDTQMGKMSNSVEVMQSELKLLSNDFNDSIIRINETASDNHSQLNEIAIDFERLESLVTDTTNQQQEIILDLIKEINHLKVLLSKNKNAAEVISGTESPIKLDNAKDK